VQTEIAYPARVTLAQRPTPLQYLPRASKKWGQGRRLWIKRDDLTGSVTSGNKIRKLEFIAGYAQSQGFDALVTCGGAQSNHARATAAVAAQLGLHCVLMLRGDDISREGNQLLDRLLGAEIERVTPKRYQRDFDALFEDLRQRLVRQGYKPLMIPTGGSDDLGIWGYVAAAEELAHDFDEHELVDPAVVCATGSGGTQAGLTLGMAVHRPMVQVTGMAVCDSADWFQNKVATDITAAQARWSQFPTVPYVAHTIDDYIGAGYGIADDAVYSLIAEMAALEGIVLDPVYTGKAFLGMITELQGSRLGASDDVVFVHTGGVFGLFPHAENLEKFLK